MEKGREKGKREEKGKYFFSLIFKQLLLDYENSVHLTLT